MGFEAERTDSPKLIYSGCLLSIRSRYQGALTFIQRWTMAAGFVVIGNAIATHLLGVLPIALVKEPCTKTSYHEQWLRFN